MLVIFVAARVHVGFSKWLFVFNSNFLCMEESHRSGADKRQRYDHPPPMVTARLAFATNSAPDEHDAYMMLRRMLPRFCDADGYRRKTLFGLYRKGPA